MKLKRKILNIFAAVVMVFGTMPTAFLNTYAADDEQGIVPAEENIPKSLKSVKSNKDGTYDITLEIEGVSKQKTDATKANVVIVYDTSGSMNMPTEFTTNNSGRYGIIGNGYVNLYHRNNFNQCVSVTNNSTGGTVYSDWECTNRYSGTRYAGASGSPLRIDVASAAVKDLASELLSQNDSSDPNFADVVEIDFIDFATKVNTTEGPTVRYNTFSGWVDDAEVKSGTNAGTNWEAALTAAKNASFGSGDNDKTYVIFVSDGDPTVRNSRQDNSATDCLEGNIYNCTRWGTGHDDPSSWNYNAAKTVANSIIADTNKEFYAVGTFGNAANMKSLGGTYYDASDKTTLVKAFEDIANKIKMGLSVADLQIADGITSATSTEIDGAAGNFRYSVPDSWGNDWGKATFSGGTVHWNPGEQKTLSNGETASVTFTVWPSQEAMDCIAAIRNDGREACNESDLTKFGLGEKEDGSFRLITNSTATFRFRTATKIEGSDDISYSEISVPIDFDEKRDPTDLPETTLQVTKRWLDSMGSQRTDVKKVSIDLYVDRDENSDPERHYTFNYQEGTEWIGTDENGNDEYTVAPGVMRKLDGTAETEGLRNIAKSIVKVGSAEYAVLEEGHGYEFDGEVVDFSGSTNHYHITKREYHPMIVDDGEIHNVIFNDDGTAVIEEEELESLAVENTLNGGILVFKVVKNNGVIDRDIEDEYQITISNIKDAEGNLLSDTAENPMQYRIMNCSLSGTNIDTYLEDCTPDGAKKPFYNGTVTATIKANQGILVGDLPTDATFEVEETLPKGYDSRSIDYRLVQYDENKNRAYLTDAAHTQKIFGNSSAQAIVTNNLSSGDLTISKTVDVKSGNKDKAEGQEFDFTVNFYEKQGDEKPVKTDTETCKGLKHGDTCEIKNIPKGWYYEITEAAKAGFNNGKETVRTGTIKQGDNDEEFVNVYKVTPITEAVFAKKAFTNRVFWLPSDNFTFQLRYNNTVKENKIVKLGDDETETATFDVTITDEGEYRYTITELETDENGNSVFRDGVSRVEGDEDVIAKIVVEDDGEGNLVLKEKSYSKEDQTIYNQYKGTTTYGKNKELEFEKVLEGRDWENTDEFTFTISSTDEDAPMPKNQTLTVKKSTADHKVDFGTISFSEADVNKVYHYTVSESFDTSKIQSVVPAEEIAEGISFTVEVEYTEDGKLNLKVSDYNNTFTNIYETTNLTAKKIWDDNDDRDGKRGDYDNLYVAVKKDDEFIAFKAISTEEKEQSFEFVGLQKNDENGEEIGYTIVEAKNCSESNGKISCTEFTGDTVYSRTIENNVITNTHTPETKKIKIKKAWVVPESGLPTTAPTFIMVEMTNDDNDEVKTIRLEGNGYGEWESEEIEVLVYKNQGEEIEYEVKETGINGSSLTGEDKDVLYVYEGNVLEGKWTAEKNGELAVKNTWTPATPVYEGSTEFSIKKVDEDDEILSGVKFEINGKSYTTDKNGKIKITVPENKATAEDNLKYEIKETEADGYDLIAGTETLKITSKSTWARANEKELKNYYTKAYTFTPSDTDGYVWNSGEYIVTNERSTANSLKIEKTFSGVSEKALKDLTFTVTGPDDFGKNGEMTVKFSDCSISGSKATCEVKGKITTGSYTVKENNADVEYFERTTTGDNTTKDVESGTDVVFKITNKYVADETSYTVTKIWEDNHDQDGKRPGELTVKLSADNKVVKTELLTEENATDEKNVWTVTWEELPIANKDGEVIEYSAEEVLDSDDYEAVDPESDEYSTTFTNFHEPELINKTGEINVKKIWEDGDNKLGIRPSSIYVVLLANGEEADSATISENENGEWVYTFEGLYKYSEGSEIEYTVEEGALSNDYSTKIEGDAENGFVITNRSTDPCAFGGCGGVVPPETPNTGRFTKGTGVGSVENGMVNMWIGGAAVVLMVCFGVTSRRAKRK